MVTAHTRLLHKERGSMSETPKLDNVSFPGGYDITDVIVAVKLAEMLHAGNVPIEPIISAIDSERASAPTSVLARLERSPSEQLRWLQSQALYQNLRKHLAQARASLA
jgi:hypothetical protein